MREVLPMVGLRLNKSVGSRRGFPTKFPPIFPRLKRIGCLNLCTKREEMRIDLVKNLLLPSVVRRLGWRTALGVAGLAVRLGIVLM